MPLRFLADHCVPNSLVEALRDAGYTVFRATKTTHEPKPSTRMLGKNYDANDKAI